MNNQVDYNNQFNKLYKNRLKTIREFIKSEENISMCCSIFEVPKQKDECLVIGTLFMSSDLKETIFDKINPNTKKASISCNTYCSEEVKYFLEDETGKIELNLSENRDIISTGMVLGVVGYYKNTMFNVKKFVFAEPLKVIETIVNTKMAFISNTMIDLKDNNLYFSIICDFLKLKKVKKLILIGNFFNEDFTIFKKAIDENDIELILISEYKDFESRTFPILPVHKKLFKKEILSFENPSIFKVDNLLLSVTSSYIVRDLLKYVPQGLKDIQGIPDNYRMHFLETSKEPKTENKFKSTDNILAALKALLKCRHLCPNSPDTVPGVPFTGTDTCFINQPLNFIFVKDDDFRSLKCEETGTILFTVPDFSKSNEFIILNNQNNLTPIKLDINSLNTQ